MPEAIKLALVGAGNVLTSPAIVGALSTYFGERHLAIHLWDADTERQDLIFRLAERAFEDTDSVNLLMSEPILSEALLDANLVILNPDENCRTKFARLHSETIEESVATIAMTAHCLRIEPESLTGWPASVPDLEIATLPHQILRWILQDEHLGWVIEAKQGAPLHAWLNEHL